MAQAARQPTNSMRSWVENGVAPSHLVATATPDNQYVPELIGVTRKLCPYPMIPRYTGGDEASHESFTCQ